MIISKQEHPTLGKNAEVKEFLFYSKESKDNFLRHLKTSREVRVYGKPSVEEVSTPLDWKPVQGFVVKCRPWNFIEANGAKKYAETLGGKPFKTY